MAASVHDCSDTTTKDRHRDVIGIFRGWYVVAGTFLVLFIAFGVNYSFGVFFEALATDFTATRASVSFVFSLAVFLIFAVGAGSGALADRLGPRPVALTGVACITVGLLAASRAQSLGTVGLCYGLGAGVGAGLAYVPAVGAVQRWFVRRRGLASGFAVTGIGVGTLLLPLATHALVDGHGWRVTMVVLAAVTATLGGAGAVLLVAEPARLGLHPDGESGLPAAGHPDRGPDWVAAIRSAPFLQLYAAQTLTTLGLFIPFVHVVPYAEDAGLGRDAGVAALALIGVGSTCGRFLLGGLADRAGRRPTLAALFAGIGVSMLLWSQARDLLALLVFALLFGTCYGGYVALIPALTADFFPGRNIGAIIGAQYTAAGAGSLAGPVLAGLAYDLGAGYALPLTAAAALAVAGAVLVWRLPDPGAWRARRAYLAGA
ncbi:MAG: MFS transporter [Gammaproteobacteria bacterium]|nr:MFS transporter [Gammaproteobacteria bacterium]